MQNNHQIRQMHFSVCPLCDMVLMSSCCRSLEMFDSLTGLAVTWQYDGHLAHLTACVVAGSCLGHMSSLLSRLSIQNTLDSPTSPPFLQSPPCLIPTHVTSSSLPRGHVWEDMMSLCGNMSGMGPPTLCLPPPSFSADNTLLPSSPLAATSPSHDASIWTMSCFGGSFLVKAQQKCLASYLWLSTTYCPTQCNVSAEMFIPVNEMTMK